MGDLPKSIHIQEEGPREGFQIEPGPIDTASKIRLIDALSSTGVGTIQVCSFVNPRVVPGWADADEVAAGFTPEPGVSYTGLWFNDKGLNRAQAFADRLSLYGSISQSASEAFSRQNLNRSRQEQLAALRKQTALHVERGIPVKRVGVMAAFGCNYQGDISTDEVLGAVEDGFAIASEYDVRIERISLSDTMGWGTPPRIEAVVGAVRSRWPTQRIALHLHDTRGMAVANAYAGLRMGVDFFDSTVGGLGGCPFAGQKGAAGNISTEELVLLCQEIGVETGIDLEALIEVGRLAETIVGHPLPSKLIRANSLNSLRKAA